MEKRNSVKKGFLRFVGLTVVIGLGIFWGCSSTHSLLKSIHSSEPVLAKRIKVVPFLDETHLGGGLGQVFTREFTTMIRKIPEVILDEDPLNLPKNASAKSPRFGIVTPKELIMKAEERGLNILITGVINPVDVTAKRTGIWPFRKNSRFYEISTVVNLIDISTGAVLFTRLESKKFKGTEDEYSDDEKGFMEELMKDHLAEILKKQVSAVSDVLEKAPWIGKIIAPEDDTIRINGGRDVGIREGYVFRVFSYGKWINAMNGRPYPIRSHEVGEIEVISVGDKEAVAKPLSGGPFTIGQVILLKS